MGTKQQKKHGAEIKLSAIKPLEMWTKLGLEQAREESILQEPTKFVNEESKMAYEAFKRDSKGENQVREEAVIISSEKGSIFIWSLLKAESKRAPKSKLSSKKLLFKDKLFDRICEKMRTCCKNSTFSLKDFEDIILYLERKRLVYTLEDGIRSTQHFTDLIHKKYGAWLVF